MKNLVQTLLVLLFACSSLLAQSSDSSAYKLLWEIRGPHSAQPSYLFGTMHVTDQRAFHMPDSVLLAIQNTSGFALEVDFDSAGYTFLEFLNAKSGSAMFDESTWQRAASATKSWDGNSKSDFDPADLFKLFDRDEEREQEATFLDAFLFRLAREQHKTICGLEDIADQLPLLMEPDIQKEKYASSGKGSGKKLTRGAMIEAYERGDIDALDEMVNQGSTSEYFKQEVVIKRNYGMAQRADSLMRIRPSFFGVGSAHLPGDEGVIELLRKRGYRLRPVTATFTGMAERARKADYTPHWQPFQRASDGYSLLVPSRPFGTDILKSTTKMYVGMDFAGGLVYCFYALRIPDGASPEKLKSVSAAIASSMAKRQMSAEDMRDSTYQGFPSKEFSVEKGKEHLRIRLVFANDRMFMLLLGNSAKVTDSKAGNDWFNSLKIFDSKPITQQPLKRIDDPRNGISIELPQDFDYEAHQVGGFPTGGDEAIYNKYEIEDGEHNQVLRVLVQDFSSPGSAGVLADRLQTGIKFMSDHNPEPIAAPDSIRIDGVLGLGATYEFDDLRYYIRAFLRYNRFYVVGFGMAANDADSLQAQAILNSLHFIEPVFPKLTTTFVDSNYFQVMLPFQPTVVPIEELHPRYSGRVDSIHFFYCHDQVSSLNVTLERAHIWPYYAGTDRELMQTVCKVKGFEFSDSASHWLDSLSPEPKGLPFHRQYLAREKKMRSTIFILPVGDHLITAKIQTPLTPEGDATTQRFGQSLRSLSNLPTDPKRPERLLELLATRDTARADAADAAELALTQYRLRPNEFDTAATLLAKTFEESKSILGEILFERMLQAEDSAMLPLLQRTFYNLPERSPLRIEVLANLLLQPWHGAEYWALQQLRKDASPLDNAYESWNWSNYLRVDSTGQHLKNLDFLFEDSHHGLLLAGDATNAHENFGWDYSAYDGEFMRILNQGIDSYDPHTYSKFEDENLRTIMRYFYMQDSMDWVGTAHKAMTIDQGYLPGMTMQMLMASGIQPSSKEAKHIMGMRTGRVQGIRYALNYQLTWMLPKRYFKPDFLADVALDMMLEEYPVQMEVMDKLEIEWGGRQQWLYIYRFANKGDRDWKLAFSGPIPQNGLPEDASFSLTGTENDLYSPNTYKKLAKKWMRQSSDE